MAASTNPRLIPGLTLLCLIKTPSAQLVPPGAAHEKNQCANLPGYIALKNALESATMTETSGLNNQMWATIVDRDGHTLAPWL